MTVGYDISLATPADIAGILALQEPNLPDSGGSLSVRLTADWFKNAILEKSVVAGRRNGKVVGYVLGTWPRKRTWHHSDYAANLPASARLLSLWPGLRGGSRMERDSSARCLKYCGHIWVTVLR
jgi:hypothetical protein